jgi:hypothetical protein
MPAGPVGLHLTVHFFREFHGCSLRVTARPVWSLVLSRLRHPLANKGPYRQVFSDRSPVDF